MPGLVTTVWSDFLPKTRHRSTLCLFACLGLPAGRHPQDVFAPRIDQAQPQGMRGAPGGHTAPR